MAHRTVSVPDKIVESVVLKARKARQPNSVPRIAKSPRVTIHIDQETIDTSVRRSSGHCMISEAIAKALPHVTNVTTDVQCIRFTDPARMLRYSYLTPVPAQAALVNFDQGIPPRPFDLKLSNAQVFRSSTREDPAKVDPAVKKARWDALKPRVRETIAKRKITKVKAAAELHVPIKSLGRYFSENADRPRVPLTPVLDAMDAWVAGKPVPKPSREAAAALAVSNGGRRQHSANDKGDPRVVGGKAPPAMGNIYKKRTFGLKQLIY